jgi:hypothetical protein
MARIALDAQNLRDYLQFLSIPTLHFQAHATANVRQPSREMDECAFRAHVFRCALRQDVGATRLIPFGAHFE